MYLNIMQGIVYTVFILLVWMLNILYHLQRINMYKYGHIEFWKVMLIYWAGIHPNYKNHNLINATKWSEILSASSIIIWRFALLQKKLIKTFWIHCLIPTVDHVSKEKEASLVRIQVLITKSDLMNCYSTKLF